MTYHQNEAVTSGDAIDLTSAGSYVLAVDDEAAARYFLTRCLEEWGYAVKAVATAAEALETMVASPASAVLCDIRMPGHDGLRPAVNGPRA